MTFFSVPPYAAVADGDRVRWVVLWRFDAVDVLDEADDGFRGIAPRQPLFEQLQLLLWCVRPRLQPGAEELEAIEEQEATDADLIEEDDDG